MRKNVLLMACLAALLTLGGPALRLQAVSLEDAFRHPPDEARPWVYWFWNNGNVTSNGITADLEAMQRVGIGGVLIMDVVERFAPPRGTAEFMNEEWRGLLQFSLQEAARLGLEVNLANGPGWCGSSGVWVTPELAMQKLVWTNLLVTGPAQFCSRLPTPYTGDKVKQGADVYRDGGAKYRDFYRDVAVLAFAAPTDGNVPTEGVLNLTSRLGADGELRWQVPAGEWVVQRIGHTTTGATTRPPVAGGTGLECDKLSRKAMDAHFGGMLGRIIATAGPLVGKSLTATHIDSWEVGGQNWTPQYREEFEKRRGYDPIPFLPCVLTQGNQAVEIGGHEMAERFRWDFQQTVSELLAENYSGRLAKLAHAHRLRLSMEGYNLSHFGDEATYTARADEPMSEFWTPSEYGSQETRRKGQQMASVAHTLGRRIVGAEAFTSGKAEEWRLHPALIKALGDEQFCRGINRFVFHRYAHQPYLDRAPGATMGPWGLHYERTQTWWELASGWHQYLARCQFLLRQGLFVADLCYLRPELPHQGYFTPTPPPPAGYRYDEISAETLLARVSIKGGRLVLPDGMSYRILVVPPVQTMTPALARKLRHLVANGATIIVNGPRPQRSPSLAGFPRCDQEVAKLTGDLWGDCDGKMVAEHALGKGRLIWGPAPAEVLRKLGAAADFTADAELNWIHRRVEGREIYFVANPLAVRVEAKCHFRITGRQPELWNPQTAGIVPLAVYEETAEGISIPLHFEPSGSMFIVFPPEAKPFDSVVSLTRDGRPVFAAAKPVTMAIQKATYGVPGDPKRTRDVRAKLQAMLAEGLTTFQVRELALGDDPAPRICKTLAVEYTLDGQTTSLTGQDPETVRLALPRAAAERITDAYRDAQGNVRLEVSKPGGYELRTASGKTLCGEITQVPVPVEISGPWQVSFQPGGGAPEQITLDSLLSWSASTNEGVKYFSGMATYTRTFAWNRPAWEIKQLKWILDLGDVQVMARVKLNGRDLGVLWKAPFRLEVTGAICSGQNTLEISVANLWPNRLIGDAALPEARRVTWSSWQPFKSDMPLLPSGLLAPVRLLALKSQILPQARPSVHPSPTVSDP